jgi:hypothetical protein
MGSENGNYYYNSCEILPTNGLKMLQSNYSGMRAINQNRTHDDMRSRLDFCHISSQNLLLWYIDLQSGTAKAHRLSHLGGIRP